MTLYQLLIFVRSGTPIFLFDIAGIQIMRCVDKDAIPANLLEYEIFQLTTSTFSTPENPYQQSALFITLQK